MVLRQVSVILLLLGALIVAVAVVGLIIGVMGRFVRSLPSDPSMTAAWIGFAGSVVGSLLTVLIAGVALYPAYRQMGEAQRASSVQAGQILRGRLRAAQGDFNILLKDVWGGDLEKKLPSPDTALSREAWLVSHQGDADQIRQRFVPRAEEIVLDLVSASSGVDLPDLDRNAYTLAVQRLRDDLYALLDGLPRSDNGARGPLMTTTEWHAHAAHIRAFLARDLPSARLTYNNKINAATQLLRYQIIEADRMAVGGAAAQQFEQWQRQVDAQPRGPSQK